MTEPKKEDEHILYAKARMLECEQVLENMMRLSSDVGQTLKEAVANVPEPTLCDLGFLFREMENILDAARKECGHKQKQLGKVLSLKILRRCVNGGEAKAVGELASATPDVKARPSMPKKGTPEWHSLLDRFGVSKEVRDNQLVHLHWPRLSEWLTKLAANGKAPPPELSKILQPESTCTYRKRKNK